MEPTTRTVRLSGFQDSCLPEIRIPPGIRQIRSSLSAPKFLSRSPRARKGPHSCLSFHPRAPGRRETCAQTLTQTRRGRHYSPLWAYKYPDAARETAEEHPEPAHHSDGTISLTPSSS